MKKFVLTSLLLSAFALNSAYAAPKSEFADIEANLKKNSPDIPAIKAIKASPIPGLYEVVLEEQGIFYADKEAKHLLFGNMIKLENGRKINLTEERMQELAPKLDFKDLKLSDAVTRKIGNGKSVIVTFEDPNCGFCKKLHPELSKLNNVTIHTFIIPILGENSREASKSILCSKDAAKSWDEYMTEGTKPNVSQQMLDKCDISSLDRNIALSRKLKVSGTPAIFFENGKNLKGYAPVDKITEVMNAPATKK